MLTFVKNQFRGIKIKRGSSNRALVGGLFAVAVAVGFAIPYFGSGGATTAAAIDTVVTQVPAVNGAAVVTAASQQAVAGSEGNDAARYDYAQLSLHDAYPYYITASFTVAGGLSLYAVSLFPSRAERRSRYASRFQTWARTTY